MLKNQSGLGIKSFFFCLLTLTATVQIKADSVDSGSDSSQSTDYSTMSVDEIIGRLESHYYIDRSGPDPTMWLWLKPPFDTCFLDSIGLFHGLSLESYPGAAVTFSIPIKNLHFLWSRSDIHFTYSGRAYIPERMPKDFPSNMGNLDDSRSVSNSSKEFTDIEVEQFVLEYSDVYAIDISGPYPTLHLFLVAPFDTLFLDSIGNFVGPKVIPEERSIRTFILPLKNLPLLRSRPDIIYQMPQHVYIPERWDRKPSYKHGTLVLEACQTLEGWFPDSLIIQGSESSDRKYMPPLTIRNSSNQRSAKKRLTISTTFDLPPGRYDVIFLLKSSDVLFESTDPARIALKPCTEIIVYDIDVVEDSRTTITYCEFLKLESPSNEMGEETANCRMQWRAR